MSKIYLIYEDYGVEGLQHKHIFANEKLAKAYKEHLDPNSDFINIDEMEVIDSFNTYFNIELNAFHQYLEDSSNGNPEYRIISRLDCSSTTDIDGSFINNIQEFKSSNSFRLSISRTHNITDMERQIFKDLEEDFFKKYSRISRDDFPVRLEEIKELAKQKFIEVFCNKGETLKNEETIPNVVDNLEEGKEKKGGQNSPPSKPKPNFSPPPQKPRSY